jgi:hypothetical protein
VLAIKSNRLPKQISLSGSLNGRPWQTNLDVPDYDLLGKKVVEKSLVEKSLSGTGLKNNAETEIKNESNKQSGIHVQWARKRIASLLTQRSLTRDVEVKDQLKADVLKLALQHHLVSPFTSLVAVDTTPVKPQSQKTLSHKLKTNAPKGTTFGLPKTATPWRLYNWLGLVCLILAALMTVFQSRMKLDNASIRI